MVFDLFFGLDMYNISGFPYSKPWMYCLLSGGGVWFRLGSKGALLVVLGVREIRKGYEPSNYYTKTIECIHELE